MQFNHTHSAILRGRWLVDKAWADSHMPLVFRLLKGEAVDFGGDKKLYHDDSEDDQEAKRPELISHKCAGNVYKVRPYSDLSTLQNGSIALVTLEGPMMKRGGMCSYGMVDQAQLINRLASSPNISGIILSIDSPGGQADGTAMLSDVIKNARSSKPVLAMIDDGMAASAAMWIASAAHEIYVTQPTDQVGSVGVYTQIADWATHYKEFFKLPVTDIYAPQSTDKNKDYRDAINGDHSGIEEDLSVLADQFINTVANNRAGKVKGDSWKTGKMFYAKDAQKIGLIDGLKSFDQVVSRMNSLIKSNSTNSNKNTMAFEKTLVAAKAESFAVTDEGFVISEEQLNNVEATIASQETAVASLETANATIADLNNQVTALNTATVAAAETNSTQAARITELEAEVAELGGQSSGDGTVIKAAAKDEIAGDAKIPSYLSDDNPANAFADRQLRRRK